MTTKLYRVGQSAVTVRDPDGLQTARELVGWRERSLTGDMLSDVVASKIRWTVTWQHLSSAEWSTLKAEVARTVPMTWQPPDEGGATYTVTVAEWQTERTEFGVTCSAVLEQS